MTSTILVTGCDKAYFLMAGLLMHSLRRCAPNLPLFVLDFGLEENQRRFLAAHCTVLERPPELPEKSHPFLCKTNIGRFLRPVDWSAMVWMDCDTLAVGRIDDSLAALLNEMEAAGSEIAACRDDARTVAGIFASGLSMRPYADALRAKGIADDSPYFNVGFLACRSHECLDLWGCIAQQMSFHSMYDQNAFNLMLHGRIEPRQLSPRIWNLHGALLEQASIGEAAGRSVLMSGGERTLVLHSTSPRAQDVFMTTGLRIGSEQIDGALKLCRNPALKEFQDFVINDFISESSTELRKAGLLVSLPSAARSPGRSAK